MKERFRQELLWIPAAVPRKGREPSADPVLYKGPIPTRVWTLYPHREETRPPALPYDPMHFRNAFLEDYGHDWMVRKGFFQYGSRAMDGGVWLLLEFRESTE